MTRYAVIEQGRVVNVVLWDGEEKWLPGKKFTVIDCGDLVGIGWTHDDDGFHAPPLPPKDPVEDPA